MNQTSVIAAAQTVPVRGDIEANLQCHIDMIRLAAQRGVSLLLFPELSLTGYELDLMEDLAFGVDDPRLERLREPAAEHAMTIVVGGPIRIDSRLHIGAFAYRPDGTVGVYTKHHLGGDEPDYADAGSRDLLLHLGDLTAALAICADANHRSHAEGASARGADVYLTSAFVEDVDQPKKVETLAGHAARHSMTVVLANFGGPSGGMASGGRSALWDRSGQLVVQAPREGPALVTASIMDGRCTDPTLDLVR